MHTELLSVLIFHLFFVILAAKNGNLESQHLPVSTDLGDSSQRLCLTKDLLARKSPFNFGLQMLINDRKKIKEIYIENVVIDNSISTSFLKTLSHFKNLQNLIFRRCYFHYQLIYNPHRFCSKLSNLHDVRFLGCAMDQYVLELLFSILPINITSLELSNLRHNEKSHKSVHFENPFTLDFEKLPLFLKFKKLASLSFKDTAVINLPLHCLKKLKVIELSDAVLHETDILKYFVPCKDLEVIRTDNCCSYRIIFQPPY